MNSLRKITYSALILAMIVLASCGSKSNYNAPLKTDTDSASFLLGYMYGKQVGSSGIENFNIDAMAKGVQDAINKTDPIMEEQQMNMFLQKYFNNLQTRVNEKSLKEGQTYLEENKKKAGIVELPSGLQYRIIQEGTGVKPSKEDQVDVVYHGTLIDGTVFDSSKDRQDTASFNVSQVVPGFSEALTLMSEGSKWEVFIPSELGYGENPNPRGPIKPNAVLIFEIDMIKVHKAGAVNPK